MLRSYKSLSTLQWALGLSVLLHAALLTVRFVDPEGFRRLFQETTLDVVLVNAESDQKPDKAQAIAQSSLAGGGEAADKRIASTPLAPSPREAPGDAPVTENQRRIDAMLEQQEQLLAQVRQQLASLPQLDPRKLSADPEARAQEERRQLLARQLAALEKRVEEENSRPRKRYLSPATLGTTYAVYYDSMRRKIEAEGTANFPQMAGRKLYGELIMALLINHDGRILDARVVRGSGNRALDKLAELIAARSAPFGNFTAAMRKDTDQFDVTARFKFTHEQTLETTLQADPLATTVRELK
ncbi:MAG TPA: TonB family protein [Ottowia sp.]|jgi:protein TonB|nr:MAG: energy transducer TonB [Burkholderiales bacterium 68-10]HMT65537.1 TonB family protein [Ottowia sp.]HMT83340.1 TonB family protein [Ottowia sp.]HOM21680.1 TonB family protein [Ottowia sp.]HQX68236.1 TonB family protein [Ottowia sp.]